jgi:hypothetical protein
MHRAGVIRGSLPLRRYLAEWGAEAKYRGVACHMPKRLPSRALGENALLTRLPFRGRERGRVRACTPS